MSQAHSLNQAEPWPHQLVGKDLWRWRQRAIAIAHTEGIEPAEVDWLLRGLCQVDSLALRLGTLAHQTQVGARVSLAELEQCWVKRIRDRVPVQYLIGETPWRQFTLKVSPAVLIPRPETELIIDVVAAAVAQSSHSEALRHGVWVDLGTGSGAIALGLAEALPDAQIIAVDNSGAAIAVAQENANRTGLGDRIQFRQGSWFEPLADFEGTLAGVVSNPPYIPTHMVPDLQPEVARYEPITALDGGLDGLDSLRHLVSTAPQFLQVGGLWLVELMIGQAAIVADLLTVTGHYTAIQIHPDLNGVARFVSAVRREYSVQAS